MKKNLMFRVAILGTIAFSLLSCRTEDEVTPSPLQTVNRFQVFTSRNGEPVNYSRGYKVLLEKYDSIHATAYTKRTLLKGRPLGKTISEEYVELGIRSQELMMKNDNERWILYPVAKGKEIIGIEVGILKNQETELEFWRMDSQDAYYKDIIDLFRLAYNKKLLTEQAMGRGGNCGHTGEEPCDTGEVVITVPKPGGPKGDPNLYLPGANPGGGDPGVIGGGCGVYGNCDGGSNPDNPEIPQNPCEKTKTMLASQKNKDITDDLKDHLTNGANAGEKGWRDNKTGAPTQATQNGDHSVNFGDPSTMNGGYHNHTGTGVNIFSSSDISTLIEIARYQAIGNAGNGYMGLVAPNGIHYVIHFNGSHGDLPANSYTPKEKEDWNTLQTYWVDTLPTFQPNLYSSDGGNTINSKGLEKLFFDTLDKMGLKNKIILQKIDNNSQVLTINNDNGIPKEVPCQ